MEADQQKEEDVLRRIRDTPYSRFISGLNVGEI